MSVSILESRTQNNIKNTQKEIFLTLAISGGYPGHSCGLGMDHLSYTWKTGLQGDQGAPGVPGVPGGFLQLVPLPAACPESRGDQDGRG